MRGQSVVENVACAYVEDVMQGEFGRTDQIHAWMSLVESKSRQMANEPAGRD